MPGQRCERCSASLSRFADQPLCPACHAGDPAATRNAAIPPHDATSTWLWTAPDAQRVLGSHDVGAILKTYRQLNGLSQRALGEQLGFDPSYVSLLERGLRTITDRGTLGYLSRRLGIPPHALGITSDDDADFKAMIQFADSTIRLAEIARQSGRAVDAVNELWPLLARLEARIADGRTERDVLLLLTQARVAFGTSLGHVLPEERLATAARWTGRAVRIAQHLDDSALIAQPLRMHGNELRKAGHLGAAVTRLQHAVDLSANGPERGAALILLARAAGEYGDPDTFDQAITRARHLLDSTDQRTILFNPFSLREVQLRGLLSTGRATDAISLADPQPADSAQVAPQWRIIERVTAAEVLIAGGDTDAAAQTLDVAIAAAHVHRLPHQIQRAIRAARKAPREIADDIAAAGHAALTHLTHQLTLPGSAPRQTEVGNPQTRTS